MSAEVIGKNVKSFVIKSVQCIVESRLGGSRVRTVGRPNGKEWFYIALNDYPDVNESTKRALQSIVNDCDIQTSVNLQLIQNDWRVCCEILLKTNDGETITLEYWTIENRCCASPESISSAHSSTDPNADRTSTLFHSYNQMSILLKSIITLSRALPAHKITENQSAESYVICYRVYKSDLSLDQLLNKDEPGCYSEPRRIGCVRTEHNVLSVNSAHRIEIRANRSHRPTGSSSSSSRNAPGNAPRVTFGGRGDLQDSQSLQLKSDHFTSERNKERKRDRPLFAAFATTPSELISFPHLADDAFNILLPSNRNDQFTTELPSNGGIAPVTDTLNTMNIDPSAHGANNISKGQLSPVHSDPIQIPECKSSSKSTRTAPLSSLQHCARMTTRGSAPSSTAGTNHASCPKGASHLSCSPGCSSLDSFVFVDLKPPFAPDDQSELGSFFNGPSPSFGDCSLAEEMEDLAGQLALMESNAQQWDQFVDSINLKSEDEFESE